MTTAPYHDRNGILAFKVGDKVRKVGGSYQALGTVVAAWLELDDRPRYVFRFDMPRGMLHIFGESQLELALD